VNHGTLLVYIAVTVHSDLILPELQQHLFQRWTVSQQRILDELMFMFVHYEHLL